jgi:hypothetical protein
MATASLSAVSELKATVVHLGLNKREEEEETIKKNTRLD